MLLLRRRTRLTLAQAAAIAALATGCDSQPPEAVPA